MVTETRSNAVDSPAPGVISDGITGLVRDGSAVNDGDAPTRRPTPADGGPVSTGGSAASERDERRHQRAIAREQDGRKRAPTTDSGRKGGDKTHGGRKRGAKTRERLDQAKAQLAEPSRRGRLALGESVSLGLIGIVVVGLGVGAVLGAAGTPGWVVGLLVAALTLVLSAALRRAPRRR